MTELTQKAETTCPRLEEIKGPWAHAFPAWLNLAED